LLAGVDEVAAGLDERVEDPAALVLRGPQPQASPKVMVPSATSETRGRFVRAACIASLVPLLTDDDCNELRHLSGRVETRDVGVGARIPLESDEARRAEQGEMVVDGRACETRRFDEIAGASDAAADQREDLDALRIRERLPERRELLPPRSDPAPRGRR
jgi:hypothetical protein